MPDQSKTNQTQDQPTTTAPPVPPVIDPPKTSTDTFPDFQNEITDIPPILQDSPQKSAPAESTDDMGSAAPTDFPDATTSAPKKKFGGGKGKVIATILGILLLVGGVGAGLIITQQRQLFEQQAKECWDSDCAVTTRKSNDGKKTTVFYEKSRDRGAQDTKDIINDLGLSASNPTEVFDTEDLLEVGLDGTTGSTGTNFLIDPKNCGSAGFKCGSGDVCAQGSCANEQTLKTACQSGDSTSCRKLCGDQPSAIQNTCVPPGPGCNMDGSQASKDACNYWHWTNCVNKGTGVNGVGCDVKPKETCPDGDCGGNEPTPTPGSPTASCQNIKAYSTTWTLLTTAQLSALEVGDQVNFCVIGVASSGTFDMARFTINGSLKPDTTTKRPGTTDYCQSYTIPAATTVFNVSAQIHHTTLGWK